MLFIYPPRVFNRDFVTLGERACYLSAPMGLFGLADYLEKQGFSTKILNIPLELYMNKSCNVERLLAGINTRIYAISLHWVLGSYGAIEVARICKRINPSATVVLGGFTASYFDLEIVKNFPFVDCIVRGEGELPLADLTEKSSRNLSLDEVPNLTFRRDNRIVRTATTYIAQSIDEMSFSKLEFMHHWKQYLKIARKAMGLPFCVSVGRGCPFNCPFCGGGQKATEIINGRKRVLLRSAEKVVEDIKILAQDANVDSVYFGHGAYPQTASYWKKLFRILRGEGFDIGADLEIWRLPISLDFIKEFGRTFDSTKSSLSFVTYPKRVRTLLGPLTDPFLNYDESSFSRLVEGATCNDIPLRLWFTVGNPFETVRDTLENLASMSKAFAKKEGNRCRITFYNIPVAISPGSPAFENPIKFGVDLESRSFSDFYSLFKNSRFTLGEIDSVINYSTRFLSKRALKFWNRVFTLAATPFFLTSSH